MKNGRIKEKYKRQETYALAMAWMKEAYKKDVINLEDLIQIEASIAEEVHPYWRILEPELRMLSKN